MKVYKTIKRIIGVIRRHRHSIYIRCNDCLTWSINMPDNYEFQCECGSWNITEYYPTRNNYRKPRFIEEEVQNV